MARCCPRTRRRRNHRRWRAAGHHRCATGGRQTTEDLCRWRRCVTSSPSESSISTRTASSSPKALRDFTKKALKKRFASLDDFLKRWKAAERKQAIIEELEAEGSAARSDRRGIGQGPRSLRPHLPCCLRPEAADPPRAGRERQEARRVRQIRRLRPAPCSTRCSPNMPTRVCSISMTPTCCASRRSPRSARPSQLIKAFGGKRGFREAVHELQSALYQESRVDHVGPHHRQIHPGHHASGRWRRWRRPAHQPIVLDVLPQDHRRSGPGTRTAQGRTTVRRSRRNTNGATWAADPEGITGEELLAFVNGSCFRR